MARSADLRIFQLWPTLQVPMPTGTCIVQLNDRELRITSRDLAMFRDLYLGTSELASRMSELLWLDIYTWETAYGINASEVLHVIQDLEQSEAKSRVKPATRFNKLPSLKTRGAPSAIFF